MAKLKSILSREISGRIGGLIFYQRNGTDCIRSMTSSYKDKGSEKQVRFKWNQDHLLDETFFVLCAVYCKEINQVFVSVVERNASSAIVYLPTNSGEIISYTYTFRNTL